MPDAQPRPSHPPAPLKAAVAVLVLLALASLGMGIADLTQVRASRAIVGIGSGLLMAAYAVALGLVARGLWRGRPWSRGPAVATQLIQLPVAYSFLGWTTTWIGLALGGLSLVVLGCVLSPAATRVLVAPPD